MPTRSVLLALIAVVGIVLSAREFGEVQVRDAEIANARGQITALTAQSTDLTRQVEAARAQATQAERDAASQRESLVALRTRTAACSRFVDAADQMLVLSARAVSLLTNYLSTSTSSFIVQAQQITDDVKRTGPIYQDAKAGCTAGGGA